MAADALAGASPADSFRSERAIGGHAEAFAGDDARFAQARQSAALVQERLRQLPVSAQGVPMVPDDTASGTSNGADDLVESDEDSDLTDLED
jgi:hypothetical protein